ncbi:MAG: hypothetical protein AB1762_19285 [Gemmatimonadota bacterium]
MIEIGRASASQVIAAYRHDFAVRRTGTPWPESPGVPPAMLPLARLVALHNAHRPVFWPLEAVWSLYEVTADELMAVRSMWGDPPYGWTIRELIDHTTSGAWHPPAENEANLQDLELLARRGTLPHGQYVAVDAKAQRTMGMPVPGTSNPLCLVDGHHRLVALARAGALPQTCQLFVGRHPVAIGTAVLNGKH